MTKFSLAVILTAALASQAVAGQNVTYSIDGQEFEGYAASVVNARGTIVVIHDWDGLTDYEMDRVDMLADMGFNAFAADLYGKGNRPESIEANKAETSKLYEDRELMRTRILAAVEQSKQIGVDWSWGPDQVVVIGYCFGGAAVLELARSGEGMDADVVGYATFHGVLDTPEGQSYPADTAPVLITHGGADPVVSMAAVAAIGIELEASGIKYDIQISSGAGHGFTVFGGRNYDAVADQKSWTAFAGLLNEVME